MDWEAGGWPRSPCNSLLISRERVEKGIEQGWKRGVSLSNRRRHENWIVPPAKDVFEVGSYRNVLSPDPPEIFMCPGLARGMKFPRNFFSLSPELSNCNRRIAIRRAFRVPEGGSARLDRASEFLADSSRFVSRLVTV